MITEDEFHSGFYDSSVNRVIIKNHVVYSCADDATVKAFSILDKKKKFEFSHAQNVGAVRDIVIGREGTPLQNRIITISMDPETSKETLNRK